MMSLYRFFFIALGCWGLGILNPKGLLAQHQVELVLTQPHGDAEEHGAGSTTPGVVDLNSTDLELGMGSDGMVGLRFTDVPIPLGAQVVSAYLQFTCDEVSNSVGGALSISAEASPNPSPFSFWPQDLSSRSKFTQAVQWTNLAPWERSGAIGVAQRSPDIGSLIQAITDQPNWNPGQAMALFISGNGLRIADSYDGDPDLAPRLIINYLDDIFPVGDFPVSRNSVWKYHDQGMDLGSDWITSHFNDQDWEIGMGSFGYGNLGEATLLNYGSDPNQKYITSYFRHEFMVEAPQLIDSLILRSRVDDGMVVYLNGQEILRRNMPSGPITYQTPASHPVSGAAQDIYYEVQIGASLKEGQNILAVEVHQHTPGSQDLIFDLELDSYRHPLAPAGLPFFHNQEWSYLDGWMNDAPQNWQSLYFDDSQWDFGQAPLGYGRENEVLTEISYGPDSLAKPMTAYFRREIYLESVQDLPDSLLLGLKRDDGAVVYVNGAEVWRSNMPVGELNHHSPAAGISLGQQDYHTLSTGFFQQGLNVIGVEVHQASTMDPDLIFDLELMPIPQKPSSNWSCPGGQVSLACFASLNPSSSQDLLVLPPSHRWQLLFSESSLYSSGESATGNFGFLGYQGQNDEGQLLIGHESSPGKISNLNISLDAQNLLWKVDSSESFGFDLFTTGESGPFSGGAFTPWGSLFLVESQPLSGDYNGDGRADQGWILEWNPVTKEPVAFANQQAKGFAMGRIARRDIAFGADGKTLYFGHSGQEGYLYKFIAHQVGSFDQGELMVLRLSDPFYGGEPLGTHGTWQSLGVLSGGELEGILASTPSQAIPFGEIRGVEYHAKDGKVYFSSRATGRIYCFEDLGSSIVHFEVLAGGQSYYVGTSQSPGLAQLGGLEQMSFDSDGNLWFLESGSNSRLWVIREGHSRLNPQMDLMAVLPQGVKGVSLSTSPDGKYLFLNVQVEGVGGQAQLDASFTSQTLNRSATLIIARKEHLGVQPPAPGFTSNRRAVEVGENVQFLLRTEPQPDSVWWHFEGGFPEVSTRFNPEVSYADPGSYGVKLIVAGLGGRDTLERQNYVQVNAATGFSSLGNEASLKAYPNPVLDWLYVDLKLTHQKTVELSLYTLDGRELSKNIQKSYPAGAHQLKIEPPIYAGPMVLRIKIGTQTHSEVIWSQRE